MKLLCASNNLAFVHTLRIALDGEGIGHHFSDADLTLSSIAGPMTGSAARLYVLNEDDWERAVELFREIDGPENPSTPASGPAAVPGRRWPRWLIVLGSALIGVLLGAVLGR